MKLPSKQWMTMRGTPQICSTLGIFAKPKISRSFSGFTQVSDYQHVGSRAQYLRSIQCIVQGRQNEEQSSYPYQVVYDRLASGVSGVIITDSRQSVGVLNFKGVSFHSLSLCRQDMIKKLCYSAQQLYYSQGPMVREKKWYHLNDSFLHSQPTLPLRDTMCHPVKPCSQGCREFVDSKSACMLLLTVNNSAIYNQSRHASGIIWCNPEGHCNQGARELSRLTFTKLVCQPMRQPMHHFSRELLQKCTTVISGSSCSHSHHPARHYSQGSRELLQKSATVFSGFPSHGDVRYYSQGGRETVEKQLLHLMEMWEMGEAVLLLRQAVERGHVPHANVILNLQQQLAHLGEVEFLLNLHDFLKEHNLSSDNRFFKCLQEAYYNSGRISEGVSVLRLLYHRTRVFADVEVYFTLLTVMVLQHFPDRLQLIIDFVRDLKDAESPMLEPEASLWKCYIMAGQWSEADHLILSNEELHPLLPRQVARICQGVDRVQCDQPAVLTHMLTLPFMRQKLKVQVAETLITHFAKEKQWQMLLKTLNKLKTQGLPLHSHKLRPVLEDLRRYLTPQYDQQLEELHLWCNTLQGDKKE